MKKQIRTKQPLTKPRKSSLRKWAARLAASVGVVVLVCAVLVFGFGDLILNSFAKEKVEQAFASSHPGWGLRIGQLEYSLWENRLVSESVLLSATNSTFKAGQVTVSGVRWTKLLAQKPTASGILSQASLEVRNVVLQFADSPYEVRCSRLRASVPASELIAETTELRLVAGDEEFFAADPFRTTRYRVLIPECRVAGLSYSQLLQGTAYRAQSIHFSRPTFDALVNRDKPRKPFTRQPLMIHEALAALRQTLQLDALSVTNGQVRYCERRVAGAAPGVLTFESIHLSAKGIVNHAPPGATVSIQAQGDLMNAGTLKVSMSIPVATPEFSLHYSGSLSAMDLTRLNDFLENAEYLRIKSGHAEEAAFDINVTAGRATGEVRAIYRDLEIMLLDHESESKAGVVNRVASFLTNIFKIRNSNKPDATGSIKAGLVIYERKPSDTFLQFAWFALRTGVLDSISF